MEFAGYFSYLLIAETLVLVAGQSLYDYGLNAGQREAVKRTGMIDLNFKTAKRPPATSVVFLGVLKLGTHWETSRRDLLQRDYILLQLRNWCHQFKREAFFDPFNSQRMSLQLAFANFIIALEQTLREIAQDNC